MNTAHSVSLINDIGHCLVKGIANLNDVGNRVVSVCRL